MFCWRDGIISLCYTAYAMAFVTQLSHNLFYSYARHCNRELPKLWHLPVKLPAGSAYACSKTRIID